MPGYFEIINRFVHSILIHCHEFVTYANSLKVSFNEYRGKTGSYLNTSGHTEMQKHAAYDIFFLIPCISQKKKI